MRLISLSGFVTGRSTKKLKCTMQMFHGNLPTLPMSKSAKPCSPHGILQFFVPPHIIFTVSKFAEYSHFPGYLSLLSTFFIFMTSFINPFIYGYMNRAFITEFKKCFLPKRGHSVTNELATRRSRNLQAARSKEKDKENETSARKSEKSLQAA